MDAAQRDGPHSTARQGCRSWHSLFFVREARAMPPDIEGATPSDALSPFLEDLTRDARQHVRVGPYTIVRMLGEGGMGTVYLAEQSEPVRRQVAIKVLRGGGNSSEVIARFRSEQQTLAMMDHPNITQIYDAGTTESGLAYIVMEYVVGNTITAYASEHHISVRERIRLFVQVCRAVQHAHQKGIIHRDIKPSNVVVTETDGEPMCKVIDFGLAKAIAPTPGNARLTATGIALGTPAYMSPEQFLSDGADVDTRADIYALGAMLYELLAGVLPFDPARYPGWAALLAQRVSNDPPRPSAQYASLPFDRRALIASERRVDDETLRGTLAGDLDCVILHALERDRERRYATANAFVLDLDAHLENKPVSAHTASIPYRAGKFVRRHRISVAFAAVVLVLLGASAVGAAIQARRVAHARALAVARQGQAEELISFMLGDLRDKLTAVGRLDVLDAIGDRALAYFAAVPAAQLSSEELYRRAEALQQLGEVRTSQGKLAPAADLMRQSIQIAERLAAKDSLNGRWQIGLAHSQFWAGNVDWELGNVDSALVHFLPFVTISKRLIEHYPDSLGYREELAYALNNIGFAKQAKGDLAGAVKWYQASRGINQELVTLRPDSLEWQVSLAAEYNAEAVAQRKLGDLAGALSSHGKELEIKEALLAHDTTNRERQHYIAIAHAYRGELRVMMGDIGGAVSDARAAHGIYASLVAHDTSDAVMHWSLAKSHRQIAQALLERSDAAGALEQLHAGDALISHWLGKNPDDPYMSGEAMLAGIAESRALLALGRVHDALASARRASSASEAMLKAKPNDIEAHRAAGDAYVALGTALSRSDDARAASDAWSRAIALEDSLAKVDPETELLAVQAAALINSGRRDDAKPIVAELTRRGYRRPTFVRLVREQARSA
jgi:eukaryotic-like serine/threonine-protein kinase